MMRNVGSIIFLILFFGGSLWLIGSAHYSRMKETVADASRIEDAVPTPIIMATHTCNYLLPNPLHKAMNYVMCWSCVNEAEELHQKYIIFNPQERCGARGKVSLLFTRKPL